MRTSISILTFTFLLCALSTSHSAPEAQKPEEEEPTSTRGGITATKDTRVIEPWVIAMYGKTLSSIGDIISVHFNRQKSPESDSPSIVKWTHQDLWSIIEHSEMKSYVAISRIASTTKYSPPFTINYSNGMKASFDSHTVVITLPDGRADSLSLTAKTPNKSSRTNGP